MVCLSMGLEWSGVTLLLAGQDRRGRPEGCGGMARTERDSLTLCSQEVSVHPKKCTVILKQEKQL